jgi:peptidoglycan/LPS O-acetylase OafA/YrhL
MSRKTNITPHLDWLNPLKGLALLAILLNHLVEEFGPGPWFTNPSNNWPDLATRMANVFPHGHSLPVSIIQFLGWLGDSGPGVFILASGIGLTWATLHRPKNDLKFINFFKRRVIRIYPLYIAMHFIFLTGAVFIPDSAISKVSPFSYTLASPYTILSMLGLRCTDTLFFGFISPAWWFVWLIIQLYLLFPFLYLLMEHIGLKWFLIITCIFTFASRFFAILNPNWLPYSLFNWMTGIFFGTRLSEFCIGMAIAVILFRLKGKSQQEPMVQRVFAWALPIYLLGLICSFTWVGSVVSNLLVTLGMAGLFYSTWTTFIKKVPILSHALVWIGVEAYSVYLVHQPPLKLTGVLISVVEWHLAAALIVLAVSFPVGWLINQAVRNLLLMGKHMTTKESFRTFSFLVAVVLGLAFIFFDPPTGWESHLFFLL